MKSIRNDMLLFEAGFDRFKIFLNDWQEGDRQVASKFNLFSILKVDWKEALLHTPFLTNLLNPSGTHSQGTLFYQSFIETFFAEEEKSTFLNIKAKHLFVKDEVNTGDGQIDILISHEHADNNFVLAIENKIYSGDQDRQLERYYYSLKKRTKGKVKLIYLTLQGESPTDESLNSILKLQLTKDRVLHLMSYKLHVVKWMETCIPLVKAPIVKVSLEQYLSTIESLCYEKI